MSLVERAVLRHKAYIGVGAEGISGPSDNILRTREASGKNEMAHKKSFRCEPSLDRQVPDLSFHLHNGKPGEMRITLADRCVGEPCRDLRAPVFKVREIDIHKPIEQLERFNIFVGVCVIDERYADPLSFCFADGKGDKGGIRRRAYEVNIVAACPLKLKEYLRELFRRERTPDPLTADLVVLAKKASQIAGGKEYVPGAIYP